MTEKYVLDRAAEIDRLERQVALVGQDRVRDHLEVAEGHAVLDAGSGSGWLSRLIAREISGATVTGIDITPAFVDYAHQRGRDEGLGNLSYTQGDITDLPFEDGSFDVVWSQFVIFFLPNPDVAISEFARVLRPGGHVKVAVTDGPFETIWPERPALTEGIRQLRETVMHGWRMARVPQMLEAAGLSGITMHAAVDRAYSFVGGASPEQRKNIEESYVEAILSRPELVGGRDKAERLVEDLLDFVDDPESQSINTHWVFGARKP